MSHSYPYFVPHSTLFHLPPIPPYVKHTSGMHQVWIPISQPTLVKPQTCCKPFPRLPIVFSPPPEEVSLAGLGAGEGSGLQYFQAEILNVFPMAARLLSLINLFALLGTTVTPGLVEHVDQYSKLFFTRQIFFKPRTHQSTSYLSHQESFSSWIQSRSRGYLVI